MSVFTAVFFYNFYLDGKVVLDDSDGESKMDELTRLEILIFANEFLNCCNRYRNEPLGADKNSLDWWKAKKEEYPTLARLAMKNLCVS